MNEDPDNQTIYYVVDSKGWVQHRRVDHLQEHFPHIHFKVLTAKAFSWFWKLGMLRQKYIYFTNWRIVHGLLAKKPSTFQESDYRYFMTSVTSHMNVGGGLKPELSIPNRTPDEAIQRAIEALTPYRVVTVNSLLLHELLNPHLSNVVYCPNGVNIELFQPSEQKVYDPQKLRIGWIGKQRTSKNYETLQEAIPKLESLGYHLDVVAVPKNTKQIPMTPPQVAEFYHQIDYYLCTSWNEGTPNPGLEAGASGIPVVSTRVGNMCELIEHENNGFFIDPTVDSIVQTFEHIKSLSAEDYQSLSQNIRNAICKDWTWDQQLKSYETAFAQLTS